jgi:hypothetical protein
MSCADHSQCSLKTSTHDTEPNGSETIKKNFTFFTFYTSESRTFS